MKIAGEHTLSAPRDVVWQALLDPAVLSKTLPGCQDLEATGEHEFRGKISLKVGPVQGLFEGKVSLSELQPPASYRLSMEGRGAPGFVNGKGRIELHEEGGSTRLSYEIDAQVGGRIAGVGQRLLDSSAKVLTRQGIEGLDEQIRQRYAGPGDSPPKGGPDAQGQAPSQVQAPSQAKFAARFIGGVLGELIPKKYRAAAAVGTLVVFLAAVLLALRACGG